MIDVDYEGLLTDLHPGDRWPFGDGAVIAEVESDRRRPARGARVTHGGLLQGRPGLHIPSDRLRHRHADPRRPAHARRVRRGRRRHGGALVRALRPTTSAGSASSPTPAARWSSPRSRPAPRSTTSTASSRPPARSWSPAATSAPRCRIEELPHLQKRIIQRCITLGRPAITATQMLESMVTRPRPPGPRRPTSPTPCSTDPSAVMLSGETAIGHDPVNAVATMARIADPGRRRVRLRRLGPTASQICSTGGRRRRSTTPSPTA